MPPKIPIPGTNINNPIEKNNQNTIEGLKKQNNPFDLLKAQKTAEAIQLFAFEQSGNFYNSMSGKNTGLIPNVDYIYKKAGDFSDLKKVMQKKLDDFWASDDGKKISNQIESFSKKNPDVLETDYDPQIVTKPLIRSEGWLHYVSNYMADPSSKRMNQPQAEHGESKYRIYFSPKSEDSFKVFFDVINELNKDTILQKKGFKAKTLDWFGSKQGTDAYIRIFNQKDKMVFYFTSEETVNRAIEVLQKYGENNRSQFSESEIFFGQPIFDKKGAEISGIVITDHPSGMTPPGLPCIQNGGYQTFNDMQASIIENTLIIFINDFINKDINYLEKQTWFKQIKPIYEKLRAISTKPRNGFDKKDLKAIFSDPNGMYFVKSVLIKNYPEVAKKFGVSENNTAFKK